MICPNCLGVRWVCEAHDLGTIIRTPADAASPVCRARLQCAEGGRAPRNAAGLHALIARRGRCASKWGLPRTTPSEWKTTTGAPTTSCGCRVGPRPAPWRRVHVAARDGQGGMTVPGDAQIGPNRCGQILSIDDECRRRPHRPWRLQSSSRLDGQGGDASPATVRGR